MNKMSFIVNMCKSWNIGVLSVCETWLVGSCPSSYVSVPGYSIFRGDVYGRIKKHGTLLFILDNLNPISVEVSLPNLAAAYLSRLDLYVISVYRPPSYSDQDNDLLRSFLLEFCTGRNIILMGDFNLPSLQWGDDVPIAGYVTPLDSSFYEVFSLIGVTQWVQEPTFVPSDNILDLIFTSECDFGINVFSVPPLPWCHHIPMMLYFCVNLPTVLGGSAKKEFILWYKGRYNLICENLDLVDWSAVFLGETLESCWSRFVSCIEALVARFIPVGNIGDAYHPQLNPPKSLIRERSRAWSNYKRLRHDHGRNSLLVQEALDRYKEINYRYRSFSYHMQCDYEERLASQLSYAPKLFHGYIRRKKKGKPPVGPLKVDGCAITDCKEMAEVFVDSFSTVFQPSRPHLPQSHQVFSGFLEPPNVSYAVVLKILQNLDGSSSPGPDGLHPHLLKSCAQSLAYPLSLIFSRIHREGYVPAEWKVSNVVPIIKKGSRAVPLNYRPISLTSVCCKLWERILTSHLLEYLESNELLSSNQYGFRPGKGTEDQLLVAYNDVTKLVDSGKTVLMAFLDFSKAFDVVCHGLLLEKLRCLGVGEALMRLFESFLVGRSMAVSVYGSVSSSRPVTSGVPQGSVLGPVLFLVYVNYVMRDVRCEWVAFADDFKLWCVNSDSDLVDGAARLQSDLSSIDIVSRSWNMNLNASKSVLMKFGPAEVSRSFYIGSNCLEYVNSYKDLGVIIDPSLRFHIHVRTVAAKAGGMVGELLRSTVCRSPNFMITLFVAHIRPIIEYGSCIWNTGYLCDIRLLESIQRRWTAEVVGLGDLEYGARLRRLGLYSIYGRLLRRDLVMIWKIFNLGSDASLEMFEISQERRTRGHIFKLVVPRYNRDFRQRWFAVRCINRWNCLPASVVTCSSLCSFKVALDQALGDLLYKYS